MHCGRAKGYASAISVRGLSPLTLASFIYHESPAPKKVVYLQPEIAIEAVCSLYLCCGFWQQISFASSVYTAQVFLPM